MITGRNGQGKTSLLEAVAWAATASSFRRVPDAALVRSGCESAVLHVDVDEDGRAQRVDAELRATGRNRILLNHNALVRTRDLLGVLRITVFTPDDLALVKGGPAERRTFLDDLLVAVTPRYDAARSDFERVLRQRNVLLRGGVTDPDTRATLDVFDEQLVRAGGELVRGRLRLAARLTAPVGVALAALAGREVDMETAYLGEWVPGGHDPVPEEVEAALRKDLGARRHEELRRGVTLVGPHRDDWRLKVGGLDSRTQASQGEQRSLALALRLAGHGVCTDIVGSEPVLLLDDVFSELDAPRAERLVGQLPRGQTLVTTAGSAPPGVAADASFEVGDGAVLPR